MTRVVIVQEYVPSYRQPFFEALISKGRSRGLDIVVAAGQPNRSQSVRGDATKADFVHPIKQWETNLVGKRFVVRVLGPLIKSADLVILEQARRNLDAYRMVGRRKKPYRVALWGHGRDYVKDTSRLEVLLQRFLAVNCDWFFAYTNGGADHAIQLGVPQDRITIVRNSVDTRSIDSEAADVTENDLENYRRRLGLTEKVAVFVGGLDASKRIPFLLEAAKIAYSNDQDFRLLVVGDGDDRDLVERAAQECDGIVYAGPLFGRDKILALLASQLIAMPGRVGLVAVDSFAAGRPIVTTQWPWHAPEFEYLSDGVDSLVTEDDTISFAKALRALSNDKSRLNSMQQECRQKSRDYSIEAMADRFLAGIELALGESGPA